MQNDQYMTNFFTLKNTLMKLNQKFSILILTFNFFVLTVPVSGQLSGTERVIIQTNASYSHSLSPANSGYSYVWDVEGSDIVYQAWDSIVVNWQTDGQYSVALNLLDSSDFSMELLDELIITVVRPIVEYGYDAVGNRISRDIVYYSGGIKKGKRTSKEIVKELENSSQSQVYPNPTDNVIYLKLDTKMTEASKKYYTLYDNFGKMVKRENVFNSLVEIPVSGLNNGVYYLVFTYDNHRKEWKIIKY